MMRRNKQHSIERSIFEPLSIDGMESDVQCSPSICFSIQPFASIFIPEKEKNLKAFSINEASQRMLFLSKQKCWK